MYVLGIDGGYDLPDENLFWRMTPTIGLSHDAAAVLLKDGKLIAASEEERISRVKHSNRAPLSAAAFCLKEADISIHDVDFVATYLTEDFQNNLIRNHYRNIVAPYNEITPVEKIMDIRGLISDRFSRIFDDDISSRLRFVKHHIAHAQSAYAFSGYQKSLIAVFDAMGDGTSGLIGRGENGKIENLRNITINASLGAFYVNVINHLGFQIFDEYKVMGLAPYGDPSRFRSEFKNLYTLMKNGNYTLAPMDLRPTIYNNCTAARKKGQPIEQQHKDMAAALQEALENIVIHVLTYFRKEFSLSQLCLAGGVAHNCTMNGKIASSGLFDSVFVPPAAHDAGGALGAAFQAYLDAGGKWEPQRLGPAYFGHNSDKEDIQNILKRWTRFITFERVNKVEDFTASLLADGQVVGWVQGKSEFGPRALGNRSIIADPRPAENREIINAMIKKREGFRPFAPSVIEEEASKFFDIPKSVDGLQYMVFVVDVKEDKRKLLGAITHVNGTARVQTVSSKDNPRYWKLIRAFGEITGIPIILNTSFNNNAEPIVDTVTDAIVCFLTTELDCLVVGDFVVNKIDWKIDVLKTMVVTIPPFITINKRAESKGSSIEFGVRHSLDYKYPRDKSETCTKEMYEFLMLVADKPSGVNRLSEMSTSLSQVGNLALLTELNELWSKRILILSPWTDV